MRILRAALSFVLPFVVACGSDDDPANGGGAGSGATGSTGGNGGTGAVSSGGGAGSGGNGGSAGSGGGGAIGGSGGAAGGPSPTGEVDLTGLPATATADTAAYSVLDVPAMPAGASFEDPVTGVRTVKLSSSTVPANGQWYPYYSTLGLQISQAWGPNADQYTIAFTGTAGNYLCDYQLGGAPTNYRAGVGAEGRIAFARTPGNERVLYVATGGQLRRYDTGTNSYADTGGFPFDWSMTGWLQLNHTETWATALGGDGVTALNLATSSVITQAINGLDEIYAGYADVALINAGSSNSRIWDLASDTTFPITKPNNNFGVSHVPSMRGYWMLFDSNTGGGSIQWARLGEDGTSSAPAAQNGYWGQSHSSGHWQQGDGNDQYYLVSNWSQPSQGWTASLRYALVFLRTDDASARVLGHHYSESPASGTDDYWSQPHATQSTDGKLVIFGSNMLDGPRIDLFLIEVPRN